MSAKNKKRTKPTKEEVICKNWYFTKKCSYGDKVRQNFTLFVFILLIKVQIRSCFNKKVKEKEEEK